MDKCQGKTKSGAQCKRQAVEGSEYCSSHQPAEDAEWAEEAEEADEAEEAEAQDLTQDLMLIALGLAATGALFLVLKTVGRWFPKF